MTNLSLQQLLARVFLAIATMVFFGAIASMIVQRSLMVVMGGVREYNPWRSTPRRAPSFRRQWFLIREGSIYPYGSE
jgi:hypothetical protein